MKIRKQNLESGGQTKVNAFHYPESNCFSAIKARQLKNMAHKGCLDPAHGELHSLSQHFSKNICLAFGNLQKYLMFPFPEATVFRARER